MKNKAQAVKNQCPCGSKLTYDDCCFIWHDLAMQHETQPEGGSAESLMRSRYSAYVLGLHAYLLDTWAPETRPKNISLDDPGIKWLGLRIVSSQTGPDDQQATVEFVARSRLNGKGQRHHEVSRFKRINGRWHYVDGQWH